MKCLASIAIAIVLAACGGQAPDAAATSPAGALTAAPASTTAPVPPLPTALPNQAPDLEAVLPRSVAGRELSIWSVRGRDYLTLMGQANLTEAEVGEVEAELALEGLKLDDVAQAIAGRSDVANDPPYFMFAYRFGDVAASELPISGAAEALAQLP